MENGIHIEFEGKCEQNRDVIKDAFLTTITTLLNSEKGACEAQPGARCLVTDVELHCGHRAKRSVVHHVPNQPGFTLINPLNKPRIKRKIPDSPGNETQAHAVLQFVIHVSINNTDEELGEMHQNNEQHPLIPIINTMYMNLEDLVIDDWSFSAGNLTVETTQFQNDVVGLDQQCAAGSIQSEEAQFPSCCESQFSFKLIKSLKHFKNDIKSIY